MTPRGEGPQPRTHRGVPERWLLPPAPREPEAAVRWHRLPFHRRRALARVGPDDVHALPASDVTVVAALAQARLATAWRLVAAAIVLGWLVLMTLWGFGRTTSADAEIWWLIVGLVSGMLVGVAATVAVARRLRRARRLLAAARARR